LQLYKSVKIKAFIIFLAWGVVFLHGVIPHIHISEQHGLCQSLLHDSDATEHNNADSDHFKGVHNDHEKVCHFSTIMFQQQGFEELLANTSQRYQIIPVAVILTPIVSDQYIFRSHSETGPSLLRAPPAA
jgi:hypothetical protein